MAGSRVFRGLSRASTGDRKSTRLNSSHLEISYAVFCLKKKKNIYSTILMTAPQPYLDMSPLMNPDSLRFDSAEVEHLCLGRDGDMRAGRSSGRGRRSVL